MKRYIQKIANLDRNLEEIERNRKQNRNSSVIIYLERDDDVPSIRDRLEWTDARKVLLVVPPGNHTFRSLVNIKLLARHSRSLNMPAALVTYDRAVHTLARQVGVRVFNTVEQGKKANWIREDAPVVREHGGAEVIEKVGKVEKIEGTEIKPLPRPIYPEKKPPKTPRYFKFDPREFYTRGRLTAGRVLGTLFLLVIFGGILYGGVLLFYPHAEVSVSPMVQPVNVELEIYADPNLTRVDYEGIAIPARLVQVELVDKGYLETTTYENAPSDFASGSVVFTLVTPKNVDFTVPVSTVVTTSSGQTLRFTTTQSATIKAGSDTSNPVQAVALEPGPGGNVAKFVVNRVEDPTLARSVRVINNEGFEGGTIRLAGVVTQADKERLKSMMLQQLQQKGYEMLQAELEEQEFIPPESLQVILLDMAYDTFAGDVSEKLGMEAQAVVRGTAIAGYHANQLAYAGLLSETPEGYEIRPDTLKFMAGQVTAVEERAVTFKVYGEGVAVAVLDEDEVISLIRGRPVEDAPSTLLLNLPLAGTPSVSVEPDWSGRVPWFPFRIDVTVGEPVVAGSG